MLRKGLLVIWLMVASLTMTTLVHAQESPSAPTLECSGDVHSENSEKSSSGDSDQGVIHHHGCHSVSHFLPDYPASPRVFTLSMDNYPVQRFVTHIARHAGPDLRPPII